MSNPADIINQLIVDIKNIQVVIDVLHDKNDGDDYIKHDVSINLLRSHQVKKARGIARLDNHLALIEDD